jgi:ABC-type antimicrobial peptide transport system permease subunit
VKFLRILKTALASFRRNFLRTMLTMLGIIIGVSAVIAMMEIGAGASQAIQRTMASMGANTLVVVPGAATTSGVNMGAGSRVTLTPQDAEAITRDCPGIAFVAPVVRARAQVVHGNRNWVPTYVYGTTPAFLQVRDWTDLEEGQPFSEHEVRNASKVCLVGQTIVKELFGGQSPLGREVRIRNVAFKVIGVLAKKGANLMGLDQDDILLAPWTTIKFRVVASSLSSSNQSGSTGSSGQTGINTLSRLYPTAQLNLYPTPSDLQQADSPQPIRFINVDQILTAAHSAEDVPPATAQIAQLLRERHRIRAGEADDFLIRDMTEITKAMRSTAEMMTNLLLCVAMISLVVGGVGIMNIMLVSVTERTREIGLRMALGAEPNDILRQFLTEAVVLCLMGGGVGILLGRLSSYVIATLLRWPTAVSLGAIASAMAVSACVGVIFGFYPAYKAARLDPIEALRYE